MAGLHRSGCIAAICCVFASACEGNGKLFPEASISLPAASESAPAPPEEGRAPLTPRPAAPAPAPSPAPVAPVPPAPAALEPDSGVPGAPPDAAAAVPPMSVVAQGPATALSLLGVAGGDPRLGVCAGGVVVGVRTTANPDSGVFGQRLTFVEPICGQVSREAASTPGGLRVTRSDSLVAWAASDGFFGLPASEVPDPRLSWVLQPATLCPESTPVVVGLAGEYDPVAPDVADTAAIRSLFIECAPLAVGADGVAVIAAATGHQLISNADAFAAQGAESFRIACEGGTVVTQIQVHAGFWLDGFVLGCSGLRLE